MKFRPEDFDAIIFDLGGVILNLDYNKTIEAFQKLGMDNFEEYYAQAQQDAIFDDFEIGKISEDEFRAYFKKTIDPNLLDVDIDYAWNSMLLDLPEHRVEFLKAIKDKVKIILFSNTNANHLKEFRKIIKQEYGNEKLLESLFNTTYYSHILGQRKPNPPAFHSILHEQDLKAGKVLFIDDSIQHVEGAKIAGLQAYHLVDKDITEIFDLS
ncbi:MAG: HAD-IA family hydrolase [Crocinitomicaceae bacterium]|nr:HAD-IA family hydrolase [Crocinitomicaceae bacterium]